ncbi:hypothetical protein HNP84_005639 [Thermocatellispora tengchongensis]|uniref:Uncharacterized protein n=1 Tax=Thermocatellispora tengchongensis TaxID=1073253 RepID=A0A840PIJ6_9ACTN|nr:hypothetical protein [Thermocatellispora tengchongensis]MBB5135895.1 hypothetical protein [Thermocatellispora tengchongensis]
MRFFRRTRRRIRDRQVEVSGRPVDDVDLDSLLALVADSLGYESTFAADGATLLLSGPREFSVRLTGLRREAARRTREDWPMLVSEHLAHAVAVVDEPLDACDLGQVRPLLRVRVFLADEIEGARVVGRHLSSDLVEVLTVGYGGAVRPVRPEEAGCWPIPAAQALDLALRNARDDERLSVSRRDLGGVAAWQLDGPTAGATAHLRHLDDYLPVPDDGVLVAVPAPGTLLVHPVEGIGVVRAIERMRLHAQREVDGREDGLSPQVYWWRDGRLTLIRADVIAQDGQVRLVVAPPPEFARLLAAIAARPPR